MKPLLIAVILQGLALGNAVWAETVKDREGAVRQDRASMENDPRWIYNDVQRGFAEAKRTGKPLLVVLRCVPCLACSGIDAGLLLQQSDVTPLMDRFVRVRVINANTLDLALFQFDFDLSFTTMFFNGDGTVYGRYGSWTHQKNAQDTTTTSFKRALESALVIHRGYPANKAALAGKQGAATEYQTPLQIPGLSGKYSADLNWSGKVVPSCVHCHQIGDALRLAERARNQRLSSTLIYPMPAPETIGLTLSQDLFSQVRSVSSGSIAAKSGLEPGDEIISLAGQPLVSVADISWILHRSADQDSLVGIVKRRGVEKQIQLSLPQDWRNKSDISGRVGTWGLRGMAAGGLRLEDLSDEERSQRGLGKSEMALSIQHVGEYGKHAAAKKAGFQKSDVIVGLDGSSERITESELIGRLLRNHKPGDQVRTTVLRGQERVELALPIQ